MAEPWADEDAQRWRQEEGARLRSLKDHETDPNPDWSLAEISRDADDLATEFYDWWNANRMDGDTLDVAFTAWATERWAVPPGKTCAGILKARIRARQKAHVGHPPITVLPRGENEVAEDYIHRIAVANGLMKADAPKKGPGTWKAVAAPPAALPPIPEGYRAPYKDEPDDDAGDDEMALTEEADAESFEAEEPVCASCGGELGPLDTKYCCGGCAAEGGEP